MSFKLEKLVRPNIQRLAPYSSARSEFSGAAEIFLDANENGFGSPALFAGNYNRYPDPLQREIKRQIAADKKVKPEEIFIGNGSDEAIDLLFRIFCEPKKDNALILPPTYGMYEVSAAINETAIRRADLTEDFRFDLARIKNAVDADTKLIFICSPNNPTGNRFAHSEILEIAGNFGGIVAVDEAYIDFASEKSLIDEIERYPNLVVLQTFSKAWGLAGLRVGMAFASKEIIALFNKVKPPYNVSEIAQRAILEALENRQAIEKTITAIVVEREKLALDLKNFRFVQKIYPSDANFLLVKTDDADVIYEFLLDEKIVVRNRARVELCEGCLRITVGNFAENRALLTALRKLDQQREAGKLQKEKGKALSAEKNV